MRRVWHSMEAIVVLLMILTSMAACAAPPRAASKGQAGTVVVASGRQIRIKYTLPAPGNVTIVINDAHGRRVRNLIGALPQTAGPHSITWDGTTDAGKPVPPGHYQWQMLYDHGIGLKYVLTYGNPGTPPWATRNGTGGWGSDHMDPQAVAAAGNDVVIGSPMAENGWYLIGVNLHGRKQWGLRNRFAFGNVNISLAADHQYLYVAAEENPSPLMHYYKRLAHLVLYRYRLSDRRLFPMDYRKDHLGRPIRARMELIVSNKMNGNLRGLALVGGFAYISLTRENRIAAVALRQSARGADCRLDPAHDIHISHPGPLAADGSDALLVIQGRQVLRINLKTHQTTVLIAHGLQAPSGICTDAAGDIFVANRGVLQQVKMFSPAGKFLHSIGVKGGRPARGLANPQGMFQPAGLAVDSRGRLWVAEQDDRPKRVSVWNISTGRLVRAFVGAPHYGATDGCVAPFDRNMAFGEGVQYRLNWKNQGQVGPQDYQYVATVSRKMGPDDVFGGNYPNQIFRYHGRILTGSGNTVEVISQLRNGYLHPLAAIGSIDTLVARQGMETGAIAQAIPALKAAGAKLAWDTHLPIAAFIWTDRNGDGIPQPSEIVWKKNLQWGGYWGNSVDRHLTVFMCSGGVVYRLPVTGWTKAGVPIYSFKSMTAFAYRGSVESGMAVSPDGKTLIVNARPTLQGIDVHTHQTLWTYPNPWASVHGSHTANVPAPGRLIGPDSITGFARVPGVGTLFAMNGNLGQQFLMTTDGLWVASLLHDWRLAHGEGMYSIQDEDFGGYFWKDRATGHIYLEAGKDDYRIFRVTGLKTIRRSAGAFTITAAQASAIAARVAARHAPRQHVLTVAVPRLTAPMKLSGNLADVPAAMHFTRVVADAANQFRFALGYGRRNLYLVWDVTDSSPFVNNGRNLALMFKSGDCVDLMLATNPLANPRRTSGTAGDERLLLTLFHHKPAAVLYKQVDPTHTWPAAFVSPSRAVYFGSVTRLRSVAMVVHDTAHGYTVMARVPLAKLGINLAKSRIFGGDVGVIFGSPTGGSARLRLYWSNKDTAITSDVPSEAALQPNHWGRLEFK